MLINNTEINNFCDENPSFDLEGFFLFFIRIINTFKNQSINDDTNDSFKTNKKIQDFLENLEVKFCDSLKNDLISEILKNTFLGENSVSKALVDTVKNTPNDYITRQLDNISKIQECELSSRKEIQENISNIDSNLNSYLEKMKISKGIMTETKFEILLENGLQGYEIYRIPSIFQKANMDFRIKKEDKPDILVDIKDYKRTVPKDEIIKFENDILLSGNHGILVSPFSNISGKINFQLSIINGCIGIYISNIGLNISEIIYAIQVIYCIDSILTTQSGVFSLSKEILDKINTNLNEYTIRVTSIKNHLTLALSDCNSLCLDNIRMYLELKSENLHICSKCSREFKNARGLGSHKKSCLKK